MKTFVIFPFSSLTESVFHDIFNDILDFESRGDIEASLVSPSKICLDSFFLMESIVSRLDLSNVKHLYSQLYKIRAEYIKNEQAIVRKIEVL